MKDNLDFPPIFSLENLGHMIFALRSWHLFEIEIKNAPRINLDWSRLDWIFVETCQLISTMPKNNNPYHECLISSYDSLASRHRKQISYTENGSSELWSVSGSRWLVRATGVSGSTTAPSRRTPKTRISKLRNETRRKRSVRKASSCSQNVRKSESQILRYVTEFQLDLKCERSFELLSFKTRSIQMLILAWAIKNI